MMTYAIAYHASGSNDLGQALTFVVKIVTTKRRNERLTSKIGRVH